MSHPSVAGSQGGKKKKEKKREESKGKKKVSYANMNTTSVINTKEREGNVTLLAAHAARAALDC